MAESLPTQYHLEIYLVSLEGDPYFHATSSTPFMKVAAGDYLDHRSFDQLPVKVAAGAALKVTYVEHIFWKIEGSHIGQKLMVATEVVPDRS
ncbi:MAG TPA: hypothetical protein VFQ67_05690 [Allosphingosinicella sp.]|jgi:hypothetical protein|nr:hypothetical protein [Allosphingosinicella sp.]